MTTIETPIQKRFSDIDSFHHVNNVSQQMYFDVGKVDYYRRVVGEDVLHSDLRIVTVSTSTSYTGQVRYDDDIRVTTAVERLGNKSFTFLQRLLCRTADGRDEIRSESRSVMVAFDFARQQSVELPDRWRRRMQPEE